MFKKIILAALMVAGISFAQLDYGIHGAANMSTFYGDDVGDAATGVGFSAGLAAKFAIPMVAIVPEVLIDMRNMSREYGNYETTLTEWALEIPVMVRVSVLPILFLEAGPTFAFNLSVSEEDSDGNEIEYDDDAFNTFEFGVAFGLGTGLIPFLDIDFRVNMGITNWMADPKIGEAPDASNLQFALGATYWF